MAEIELDPHEARVLGVLVEKDFTTPEQYPLTLNSTTLGANQKSNRDPVLDLSEGDVYAALQKLIRKGLVGAVHPLGARVEKFRHNAEAVLGVTRPELAVLCELLVRGPQQPGELRGRVGRMSPLETLEALSALLAPLIEKRLVVRLPPTPGSRAERYAQTIAPQAHAIDATPRAAVPRPPEARSAAGSPGAATAVHAYAAHAPAAPAVTREDAEKTEKRVGDLEFQVAKLRRQLDHLAWRLGEKLEC